MTIIIQSHAKGILVTEASDGPRLLTTMRLRQMLGAYVSAISQDSYLVSISVAHILLYHFPPHQAEWDPRLLDIAVTQRTNRQSQFQAREQVTFALEHSQEVLKDYSLLERLDVHQIQAVAAISVPSLQGMAIFDEQGTGKTAMALCGYDRLRQLSIIDRLLVIAPKSVLGSWRADTRMLFGDNYIFKIFSASKSEILKLLGEPHDILALNYESAVKEKDILKLVLSAIQKRYMLVVDESYYVKNPNALRSRAVAEIREHCSRAVVLCGTPAPNSARDIVEQINIADQGITFDRINVPKNEEEARVTIANALRSTIYLRRLKRQVNPDLPKKLFERVSLQLQPMQQSLYDQVRQNLISQVDKVTDQQFSQNLTSFLAQRTALLQICSNPRYMGSHYSEIPAKHLALDCLLHELIDEQHVKVVIWSYFRYSIQAIAERYAHYGVARIDGTVTDIEERTEAIRRFQEDSQVMIFLGNAAAAGAGITLTAAHHAIYESFSNQAAHYMQSVDRIHRRGQQYDVTIHVLLAQNTVEEPEFERIIGKERLAWDLLGDNFEEPMTRERFLAELGVQN